MAPACADSAVALPYWRRKFHHPRMVKDPADMGFTDIREIPRGGSVELAPGFTIHSFQFGPFTTDSAAVLQDATATLLDANDCVRKRMFSVWTPSKRLRIRLRDVAIWRVALLLSLLDLQEHEGLPLWRVFRRRTMSIWLRRWREPVSIVQAMIGLKITRRIDSVAGLYQN